MKNTKYKLFLLVSKYMPVVIAIGIFINIILAIVYEPLLSGSKMKMLKKVKYGITLMIKLN